MTDETHPTAADAPLRAVHHEGTGPGDFTPDGCSVSLYTRLPANGEPEIVAAAVPPGSSLLELGSGVGRMTRPLVARGFRVTAVDESAEMLAHVEGAPTVRSPIEDLRLDTRFDVVLLASFLVNTADDRLRAALLRTCAHHVTPGGAVLIEREGERHRAVRAGDAWRRDGLSVRVTLRERTPDGAKRTRMEYTFEDAVWSHTFLSHDLTDDQLQRSLCDAGLVLDAYLTEDRTWVRAVPA